MANLANKLALLQTSLGAPDLTVEGVLGALKPQLLEQSVSLTIADSVSVAEGLILCKAIATLWDGESNDCINAVGVAVTGDSAADAMGKARYNALANLFLITRLEVVANALGGTVEPVKPLAPTEPQEPLAPVEETELVRVQRGKTQVKGKAGWVAIDSMPRVQLEWLLRSKTFASIHDEVAKLLK